MKPETPRQAYIRHLSSYAALIEAEDQITKEGILSGELVEAKYLEGSVLRGIQQTIRGSAVSGLTVQGRLFLQELQKEEKANTFWGKYKTFIFVGIGYVLGVISPILTKLIEPLFKL